MRGALLGVVPLAIGVLPMIHPDTELKFVSPLVGFGVFATERIPKGTVVWALDPLDQVLSPQRRAGLDAASRAQLDRYSYTDDQGNHVLCWDHGRFVNHSCEASCMGPDGSRFEVALRDIAAGEQLTDDYRSLGLTNEEAFDCMCGAPSCEGRVLPPRPRLLQRWSVAVDEALESYFEVPQPLAPWLSISELADVLSDAFLEHDGYSEIVRRSTRGGDPTQGWGPRNGPWQRDGAGPSRASRGSASR